MEQKGVVKSNETEMAIVPAAGSLFLDVALFEHAQRVGNLLSSSNMVPDHFRNNIGNCVIALNLSKRWDADVFMVMQNMYIVHGRPGIESKLAIALVNATGKFTPIQYRFNADKTACTAYAKNTKTGELCEGVEVTIKMAKDEGWFSKKGSKWQTMPTLMLQYRSAMFFARAYCPEALLGMQSREELQDVYEMVPNSAGGYQVEAPEPEVNTEHEESADIEAEFEQKFESSPQMREYLAVCAKHFNQSVKEIMISACKDPDNFRLAFDGWLVMQPDTTATLEAEQSGKYAEQMPPDERDVGKAQDEPKPDPPKRKAADNWDPETEPLQKRYAGGKKERVIEALEARDIEYNPGWPGPQLHSKLLSAVAREKVLKRQAQPASDAENVKQREGFYDDSPAQQADNFDGGPAGYNEPATQPGNEGQSTSDHQYFHDIDELAQMPQLLQQIYGELAEVAQCLSEELSPKSVNTTLKRRYPAQWEKARQALGFSFIAQTDEAADKWNADIVNIITGE